MEQPEWQRWSVWQEHSKLCSFSNYDSFVRSSSTSSLSWFILASLYFKVSSSCISFWACSIFFARLSLDYWLSWLMSTCLESLKRAIDYRSCLCLYCSSSARCYDLRLLSCSYIHLSSSNAKSPLLNELRRMNSTSIACFFISSRSSCSAWVSSSCAFCRVIVSETDFVCRLWSSV